MVKLEELESKEIGSWFLHPDVSARYLQAANGAFGELY